MFTELTFAILKYGLLILIWVFVWLAVRSLHKDLQTFSPRKNSAQRRREKLALSPSSGPSSSPSSGPSSRSQQADSSYTTASLLVIIDGPLAGSSVPLADAPISVGRAASNTVVLDDEFVSSHHARIIADARTGSWMIEDLGSTNGTIVNDQRISSAVSLAAGVPVRIGATTFELR